MVRIYVADHYLHLGLYNCMHLPPTKVLNAHSFSIYFKIAQGRHALPTTNCEESTNKALNKIIISYIITI